MGSPAQILVSNDDGVQAPGLLALKQALQCVGEVTVMAPERGWSAAGHTKTMHKPLRIWQVELADGDPAYVSSGTPSDCVGLVALGAISVQPDLVVSGINSGANLGHDITYSGTVAAAMEGVMAGLPAMAVSLDSMEEDAEYGYAAQVAALLARQLLERGLPPKVLLNVNVPALPAEKIKGIQVTRLGGQVYDNELVVRNDPRGRPYYWVGGDRLANKAEQGTDDAAVARGWVSVTPLLLDMTAHHLVDQIRSWNLALV